MAEGFLQANNVESVGEKFINVLLHNSLLQVSKRDRYGNVKKCGMHDLVHDLACSVSNSSNSTGGSSRVRYMILGDNNSGEESSRIPKEMAKSLRTLLFEDTMIEYLPDWIGEFFHLQTLRANSEYLRKLPSTIKYLINLRHLYINEKVELPMGIGRLTCLQTLTHFPVGDENGCKIEELGSLNNLSGDLKIRNLDRVHDKEEAGKANLFKNSKILNLCLEWDWNRDWNREGERNDEDVLEGLQPHSDLRELKIERFSGKRFPSWTLKMAVRDAPHGSWVVLNKLMSLELWYCDECEEIPMLGQLPNLKSLELKGLSNVKCINSSFYGRVNKDTRIVFPALERLELKDMPKLAVWAEIEISDGSEVKLFPRLQHLIISECEQLMSVPSHVSSCLQHLEISSIGVKCLPADWLLSNSETLSYLEIGGCLNLREISDRCGEEESKGRSFTITSLPKFPRLTKLMILHVPKLCLDNVVYAMRNLEVDGLKCIFP